MKSPDFSTVFYASNICGLVFGIYLVTAYSLYRIIILYCLFNIVLFWITNPQRRGPSAEFLRNSGRISSYLATSVAAILSIIVMTSIESLYVRPLFMPPMIAIIVVLMAIMAIAGTGLHDRPWFMRFLLLAVISVVLFVNFSIYLVQPDVMMKPLYTTVDASRDYVNAARILRSSAVHAEELVFERYYTAFPVVPMQISVISLVTGLPINAAHLVMAVTIETIGVVSMWLLSVAVASRVEPALGPSVGVLATVVVWLQPHLIDPAWFFTPIRFTIPLVVLVFYLVYRNFTRPGRPSRLVVMSILVLLLPVIPMHATPAMFLIALFLAVGFLVRWSRPPTVSLGVISLLFFLLYLVSLAATPLHSLLGFMNSVYAALVEILSSGPSRITEVVLGWRINVQQSELDLFAQALPLALVLSMCTACIVRSLRPSVQGSEDRRLSSLYVACGFFAMAGFGVGFLLPYFRASVDMRYFVFPLTCLALVACSVVLTSALGNSGASRMKGLILIGLVALYAFSMTSSPLFLPETSPAYARLIPTESESAAARFVSMSVEERPTYVATDFPFHSHIIGLMYSSRIGIEETVKIRAVVLPSSPEIGEDMIVVLRRYFLQSVYLRSFPHVKVLEDVDRWNSQVYNRVFDSHSTSVYLGTPSG